MSYYQNREKCEFKNCSCQKHILLKGTEKCAICEHGTCWHKKLRRREPQLPEGTSMIQVAEQL